MYKEQVLIAKAIAKIVNTVDLSFGESVEVMTEIGQIYVNPVKSANGKVKNTYFAV